mgnify:CR=1 FL=1
MTTHATPELTTPPADTTDTVAVLQWAAAHHKAGSEPAATLWTTLCDEVGVPHDTSAERLLDTLGRAGGDSIANAARRVGDRVRRADSPAHAPGRRGGGVPYDEIAQDVAKALRPLKDKVPFTGVKVRSGDVVALEEFVLEQVQLTAEVEELVEEARKRATGSSLASVSARVGGPGLLVTLVNRLGVAIVQRIVAMFASRAPTYAAGALVGGLLLAPLVTGPALRITAPSVTLIAVIRRLATVHADLEPHT